MEFVFIFVVSTLIVIVPLILAVKLMMRLGNDKLFPPHIYMLGPKCCSSYTTQ